MPVPDSLTRPPATRRWYPWCGAALVIAGSAAPLRAQCPDGSPPPCRQVRQTAVAPTSVAVLYFDDLSGDSSDAVLADGLTEEIIVRLRRVERLDVRPRSAVLRFRGQHVTPEAAARVLGTSHLVSGQVRRVGTRVRVTAELVRIQGEQLVWTTSYVRPLSDAFDLSAEIAESVATAVGGRLLPAERAQVSERGTRNDVAYRHFVQGNAFLARRSRFGIRRAVEEYQAAIAADPRFAAAWARLSLASVLAGWWHFGLETVPPAALLPEAQRAAARAVGLDSTSSEAWLATAMVRYFEEPLDPAFATAAFERAVRLGPSNAEALHQFGGRMFEWRRDGAVTTTRRSLAIEPARATTLNNLAWMLAHDGDLIGALVVMDSAVSVEPDYPMGRLYRGILKAAAGDTAGALADLAVTERRYAGEWLADAAAGFAALLRRDTVAAVASARAWDAAAAPWFGVGIGVVVYVGPDDLWLALGRRADAMDSWERQPRSAKRYWIMRDAASRDPLLAADPRFQRLLAATVPPPGYR
jgi:TolB-like protein